MITYIAWILLIVVVIILVLSVSALFWRPQIPAVKQNVPVTEYHPAVLNEEEKEERSLKVRRFLQEMEIRWKDLKLIMDQTELNDALIFHWKGLHGNKRVLFSISEEEAGEALFEAVADLNDASGIPDIDFYIALPLKDDPDAVSFEVLEWMRSQKIVPDLVIRCGEGLHDMPGLPGMEALIGIGQKPSAVYQVTGDNEDSDWMASIDSARLTEPMWNRQAERTVHAIRNHLPWQIRFELLFPFLYQKKVMRDLMMLYPDMRNLFCPEVDKRGEQLYLSANDEEILKNAELALEKSAADHSVRLEKIRENRMHLTCDPEGESYQTVNQAVLSSIETDAIIPVLQEKSGNEEDYTPVETITFSPLMEGHRITSQGAVSFYENLLCKGMRHY